MNSLYNLALRQCSSIQSDLSRLEASLGSSSSTSSAPSSALQGQLSASLAALSRTVDDYENLAKRELNAAKREKAMQRVRKFRDDEKEFLDGLRRLKSRAANPSNGASTSSAALGGALSDSPYTLHARTPTAAHAAVDLGAVSNGTNANGYGYDRPDPLSSYRMNASAQAMFGGDGTGGGMSARESHALKEHSFLSNTEAQLDSFIAQGQAIWGNVREQRDILKGTQRRLRDAAVTMGLSRDVIGYIERRSTQDNILFALGAIFTLVCFFYIYKWFG